MTHPKQNSIIMIYMYHSNIVYLAVTQENEQPPAEKEAADKEGKQQLPPFLSLSLYKWLSYFSIVL